MKDTEGTSEVKWSRKGGRARGGRQGEEEEEEMGLIGWDGAESKEWGEEEEAEKNNTGDLQRSFLSRFRKQLDIFASF